VCATLQLLNGHVAGFVERIRGVWHHRR